jgi:hypothetical protein
MRILPVSLVIAACDRPSLLLETVHSVLEGGSLPSEIVVVDQSRIPLRLEDLSVPDGCTMVHVPLRSAGLSRARNAGVRTPRHEVIVITDDDVRVSPVWLGRLVGALEEAPPGPW